MNNYRCPECLGDLSSSKTHLRCQSCNTCYPIVDGLPLLCRGTNFYYGEVPRDVTRRILARATEAGWHTALLEHINAADGTDFYDYATSDLRSGFKFLLDRFEGGTVLDYGCGPGAIAASLARNFARVYATDLTLEHAQFTRLRAMQENLGNVTAFCSGDTPHIPLADKSVDLIVLDGVLGWVPDFRPGEPRTVQVEFLREMRRVLKDDGLLFIGIENRAGYRYLLGQKEEHTLLRFTSLLPRPVADFYSRRVRGRPFRTYTYTRRGYQALLALAGLGSTQFFGLLPSYREVEMAFAMGNRKMVRECLRGATGTKRIRNLVVRPFFPALVGSFGILAGNHSPIPYISRLASHIGKTYLRGENLEILSYAVSGTGTAHVKVSSRSGRYYIKLPISTRAEQRMENGVKSIQEVETLAGGQRDALLIPRPIAWDRYQGQSFLLEPLMPGVSFDKLAVKAGLSAVYPQAADYLALLGKTTRKDSGTWRNLLKNYAADYGSQLAASYRQRGLPDIHLERRLQSIAEYVNTAAPAHEGFQCAIHGDFWHGNLLFIDRGMRLASVMDWDRYESQSLPFLDLFNLMVRHAQFFEHEALGQSVINLHGQIQRPSAQRDTLRYYATELGVDSDLGCLFLVVYWIRQMFLLLKDDRPQPASAYEEAISKPLSYFYALSTAPTTA